MNSAISMNDKFVFSEYVSELGKELIHDFSRAKMSTQTVAVGSNKENGVIKKLQDLLPSGVGIGSGFVYDIFGNVSHQCDVIIYEKDFCLKTTINGNEKDSFYNCESVIAVGEVKSSLTKNELLDSLNKFRKLSKIKRYIDDKEINCNRQYLSKMALQQTLELKPIERGEYDSIYKFILCESFSVNLESVFEEKRDRDSLFNTIVSLDGKHVLYLRKRKICLSPFLADTMVLVNDKDGYMPFKRFMYHLTHFITSGVTVPLNQGMYYKALLPEPLQLEKQIAIDSIVDNP